MRRKAFAAAAAALVVGLVCGDAVGAQSSIGETLREALRRRLERTTRQRPTGPANRPSSRLDARRSLFGSSQGVIYENEYARLSSPTGCVPGMRLELRYKAAAQRNSNEWATPEYYFHGTHGVQGMGFQSHGPNPIAPLSMCREERADLTVYAPDGSVLARDVLQAARGYDWESRSELDRIRTAGAAGATAGPVAPDQVANLHAQISDVGRVAEYEERACLSRIESNGRPLTRDVAANRAAIARSESATRACVKSSGATTAALYGRIVAGARVFAAAQPASYDGLKKLLDADSNYRGALRSFSDPRSRYADAEVLTRAHNEIELRRSAIERQLFDRIVVDMNKPGKGPGFIESLFGSQDGRRIVLYDTMYYDPAVIAKIPRRTGGGPLFFDRVGDVGQSQRERASPGGPAAWGEPTANEMGLAILRAMLVSGGKQVTKNVVTVPGALNALGIDALDDFAGAYMQVYEVRKGSCRREAPGYRCGMTFYGRMISRGEIGRTGFGAALTSMVSDMTFGAPGEALFVPGRGGWRAPEREAGIAGAQARQMQQLSNVATNIVESGSSAMSVVTSARSGGALEPGEDSQAEQERKQRVEEEATRRRR